MNVAVVTTRNEAETIGELVDGLWDYVEHVVVVDEHSTDDTREAASDNGAIVGVHTGGIGPCLAYGWRFAVNELQADRILQLDAGGSHAPEDSVQLLSSGADVVVGSRFCPGAQHVGDPGRALASRAYALSMSARTRTWHTDWTSGYRAFTREAVQTLLTFDYTARMHGWQTEVLRNAHTAGLTVEEVPIRYTAGRSSLNGSIAWEAVKVLTA